MMIVNFNKNISANNQKNAFGKNQKPLSALINEDRLVDSFVTMARIDSGSNTENAEKGQIPSTKEQKNMAKFVKDELKKIGLTDIKIDKHSMITATLEGNLGKKAPVIGLFAHMDTSEEAPNKGVKPQIHNYRGGDIKLKDGTIIPANDLQRYGGQKIVTSDGKTLLGADDKAGVAEILEAIRVLKENPDLKHPKIRVAFTTDEETGSGIKKFDIKRFGADVAYTIDGDYPEFIENESFNAYNPKLVIHGKSAHAGDAKGKMVNSIKIATWIVKKLPKNQAPETTEKKQGYYHVTSMSGTVSETKVNMFVRDHSEKGIKRRMSFLENLIKKAKEKFQCEIEYNSNYKYGNMKAAFNEYPEAVSFVKAGIKRSGLNPKTVAIRGGTDGSDLSLRGLPTLNLGTGGHNYHSEKEFWAVPEAIKSTENIINMLSVWAEKAPKVMSKNLFHRK